MPKLIVFCDPHMVRKGQDIIGIDPYQRFLNGINHVNAHNADAEHVVILGDLADDGDRESYERVRDCLQRLSIPYSLMIGNHDNRETFLKVFPETPVDRDGFVQGSVDLGDFRLLLLDTLHAPPYSYPESHAGLLCEKRLAWLETQLAASHERDIAIFMHHPPHAVGFPAIDDIQLRNGPEFYATILKFKNVRHMFFGHVHRTISGSCHNIPFSIFKSTAHQQPMTFDVSGAASSVDEPAAYGIVFLRGSNISVHTEDYELSTPMVRASL